MLFMKLGSSLMLGCLIMYWAVMLMLCFFCYFLSHFLTLNVILLSFLCFAFHFYHGNMTVKLCSLFQLLTSMAFIACFFLSTSGTIFLYSTWASFDTFQVLSKPFFLSHFLIVYKYSLSCTFLCTFAWGICLRNIR